MGTGKWLGDRLLIHDYQNAKQVLNAMVLQDKTQNKKIICYLNKQNFCVSYMDVGRQNNKWEWHIEWREWYYRLIEGSLYS